MIAMSRTQAIRQYQHSGVATVAPTASPHQLIAMLLEGALDRVARARGAARNGDRMGRVQNIGSAISVVEHLRLCLDRNAGPIAQRLDSLYDYVLRRLAQANAAGDPAMLDEVADVLRPIKDAWDTMPRSSAFQ
ncbi:MAG: flagellar export chaperone FliS [Panacagrimonas sp.]